MRIVQIGPYPKSSCCVRGGVEASVFGLAQELSLANEVHVFDLPRISGMDKTECDGQVIIHRFQNKGKRQSSMLSRLNSIVHEITCLTPDICHIHGTNLYSYRMYQQLKKQKCQAIVTIHGLVRVEKQNSLKNHFCLKHLVQYIMQGWAERRLLANLPMAIVDTEYVKDKVDGYPISKKPFMYVIPQGVNEDFFSIRCSSESRTLLSVGAIGVRKGHLLTLKAFELLRHQGEEANLIIAGAISDKVYLNNLQKAIEMSDYNEHISLCPDISYDNLKHLYEKAHLFVLHTQEESQGIVFVEAMASGLPVVTTRVGGIPYVVIHEQTGLLSDYGDVESFANNMKALLADTSKWYNMSSCASHISHNYHWRVIGNKVMDLYHCIMNSTVL